MENLIGRDLGRYHILEQLGEGGMAVVYKAFDTRLEADVAVKVIRTDNLPQSGVEKALRRFEREAKSLAKLTHPNIVPIIDYGEYENSPYLVMKYLPGGTLKHHLKGQPMPWQEAAPLLIPVARALDYAHRQNMVHRDVKPSNVLITSDGEPMLTDFGIAKILNEEVTMDLTGSSATVGTPEYMAPEQVVSKNVDHRADVYALGVVFYEMVTGRRPFQADTPMAVLFKHVSEPLPRPRQFVPELPDEVEKVLLKSLAKDPNERYQTMGEFAAAFERLLTRTATRPVEIPAAPQPEPQPTLQTRAAVFPPEMQAAPPPEKISPGTMTQKPAPVLQTHPEPASQPKVRAKRNWIGIAIGVGAACILLGVGGVFGIRALIKSAATESITPAPAATQPSSPETVTEAPPAVELVTPGAGPGGSIPFPPGGRSVTGAFIEEPDNIVPYYTWAASSISITQLTLVGLAEWNDEGRLVPELAVEIPSSANGGISADGLTIVWRLRPNLRWSDGHPLTSADVKFTWESIMDSSNVPVTREGYDMIAGIDTPDDTTVIIHFSNMYPAWQTLFTLGSETRGAILPRHILEGQGGLESNSFIHWPNISSGPFVIADWAPGEYMTLLPNPLFYKGRPILDRVVIRFISDSNVALAALQAGEIDWFPVFTEYEINSADAYEPSVHLIVKPGTWFEHYLFNLGTRSGGSDVDGFCPFQDVRVRKAITLGINRQANVDNLLGGKTFVPATQWINSEWTNTRLRADPYDPEAARMLLEEAGYVTGPDGIRHGMCNGRDTMLSFNFETTTRQLRVDLSLAAQSDLRQIGVEFNLIHSAAGTFFASYNEGGNMTRGTFDMAGYTNMFFPDPMAGVYESYGCEMVPSARNPDGMNNYHICDPYLDGLMADVNASADPAVRKIAVDRLQQYIFDQYYVIPIYARASVYGITDRFLPGPFSVASGITWNAEVWDVK